MVHVSLDKTTDSLHTTAATDRDQCYTPTTNVLLLGTGCIVAVATPQRQIERGEDREREEKKSFSINQSIAS